MLNLRIFAMALMLVSTAVRSAPSSLRLPPLRRDRPAGNPEEPKARPYAPSSLWDEAGGGPVPPAPLRAFHAALLQVFAGSPTA